MVKSNEPQQPETSELSLKIKPEVSRKTNQKLTTANYRDFLISLFKIRRKYESLEALKNINHKDRTCFVDIYRRRYDIFTGRRSQLIIHGELARIIRSDLAALSTAGLSAAKTIILEPNFRWKAVE